MPPRRHIENAEAKLLKINAACRMLLKDCKMCNYYKPNSTDSCNDKECRMISAVNLARDFLEIIDS